MQTLKGNELRSIAANRKGSQLSAVITDLRFYPRNMGLSFGKRILI